MSIRLSSTLLLPAGLAAAVIGFLAADRAPAAGTAASANVTAAPVVARNQAEGEMPPLPPNHPPIGSMSVAPSADPGEPPAITWQAPNDWKPQPNANPMRIATYRIADGAELTVVRAGGSADANVERWIAQFDAPPTTDRTERTVQGLKVTVVRIAGTYAGGGGMGPAAAAAEPHPGWAMLAAIVETPGTPYFFKLLGPAKQVDRARAAFDRMLGGIAPVAAAAK
jgi:hypothetical protein